MAITFQLDRIEDQQQWEEALFPAIVQPIEGGSLSSFVAEHRAPINSALSESGAVLFRGFDVSTAEIFDEVVQAYGEENFAYSESLSNAVRVNVTPRVFTANEAPAETSIFLHHEMAQTPVYPSKLFFFCEIAPDEGGMTPLCRSDVLLDRLKAQDPHLVARFKQKGIRYANTMPGQNDPASGQGRSWRSTLGVDDKNSAEQRLITLGYDWEWLDGDALRATSPILPAVRSLADGREVFFNQLIAAYCGWADKRNEPSKAITFGDGAPIEAEDMAAAIRISDEITFDLNWRAGDVVLVDNFQVMHGRRPFQGKRRVLASLIK